MACVETPRTEMSLDCLASAKKIASHTKTRFDYVTHWRCPHHRACLVSRGRTFTRTPHEARIKHLTFEDADVIPLSFGPFPFLLQSLSNIATTLDGFEMAR